MRRRSSGTLRDVREARETLPWAQLVARGRSVFGRLRVAGDDDGLAAGLFDLLAAPTSLNAWAVDGELLGQLAVAEDLDAVAAALDEARARGALPRRPSAPASKRSRSATLSATVTTSGTASLKPRFGQATLQRRLAALEVQLAEVAAVAGLLALLPLPQVLPRPEPTPRPRRLATLTEPGRRA